MLIFISEILLSFYACFSRTASFEWFVTIVVGLMIRSDCLGLTSIIRDLALMPSLYPSLEHFFRASSWEWDSIFYIWAKTVADQAPLRRIAGRTVLIGDGTKRAADGKYMPCVKKMVQESESASKKEFIYGHFFGAVGVLIGNTIKTFCLPLSIQIHDGDGLINKWEGDESVSHVVQMLRDGFRAATFFGHSLFVLDRYFLTVPMLMEWKKESTQHSGLLHIITRAKKNCTAYEKPDEYKGRGRRPLRGASVHIQDLFETCRPLFREAKLLMYGDEKQVSYLSRVYLWGQKLYQPLRFVLVNDNGKQVILVSTDLTMSAEDIIVAYTYRAKIETMFKVFKQQFGGLCYHFWTKAVPKRKHYCKKGSPDPLLQVTGTKEKEHVIKAVKATEGYVLFASIAMGITQMLCLNYGGRIRVSSYRYLRTESRQGMSEASMMKYLQIHLFRFMAGQNRLTITKIISSKQISDKQEEINLLIS